MCGAWLSGGLRQRWRSVSPRDKRDDAKLDIFTTSLRTKNARMVTVVTATIHALRAKRDGLNGKSEGDRTLIHVQLGLYGWKCCFEREMCAGILEEGSGPCYLSTLFCPGKELMLSERAK